MPESSGGSERLGNNVLHASSVGQSTLRFREMIRNRVNTDVPNRFGVLYLDVWRMKNRCNVEPYVLGSPGVSRQTKNCDARPQASRQTTEAWGQTRMLGRVASRRTGSSVAVKPLAVETWFVLSCVSVGGFDSLPTRLVPFAFGTKR
jgi:hypothetical protein